MNILVTGATGFIGRHLTAALSKSYSVRCLVRKTSDISGLPTGIYLLKTHYGLLWIK
ncbi:MAG: NAD-dependent epimerase/dehydratase family protein [Thermodesulfobacteriota bacterium]